VNGNGNSEDDDTDGDGIPNYLDVDDDNDGINTEDEDLNEDSDVTNDDCDEDGIPDYLDDDICEVVVHDLLTPNGDGLNDYLYISGIQSHPSNTVQIYNRWGVLVYETNHYDSNGNVFRGVSEGRITVQKDKKLPVGTYFYMLVYTSSKSGKVVEKSGHLYINR